MHYSLGCCIFTLLCFLSLSSAYKNFTVGDEAGWVDPKSHPSVNYTKWAEGKSFSLGDYLIFNYPDKNHSVVVTQNHTAYTSCDYEDSEDALEYGEPGVAFHSEVPLLVTGMNYFISGIYDGEQCRNGMKFGMNVSHGEGLPPNLLPSPTAPSDDDNNGSPSDSSNTIPSDTTTLPANTGTDNNTAPILLTSTTFILSFLLLSLQVLLL